MKGNHVTELLSEYLEKTLPQSWMEKVKTHLIFCNVCRSHLTDLETNVVLLKELNQATPPEGLEAKIVARVSAELKENPEPESERSAPWFFSMKGMALAACCLLVFVVVKNIPRNAEVPHPASAPAQAPLPVESKKEEPAQDKKARVDALGQLSRVEPTNEGEAMVANKTIVNQLEARPAMPQRDAAAEAPVSELSAAKTSVRYKAKEADSVGLNADLTSLEKQKLDGPIPDISGAASGLIDPHEQVISTRREWNNLWNGPLKDSPEKAQLPKIDFRQNDAVAVFAGSKPSAGYAVVIQKVEITTWNGGPARLVHYKIVSPTPGALSATVVTTPYAIRVVPKMAGPTFFKNNP